MAKTASEEKTQVPAVTGGVQLPSYLSQTDVEQLAGMGNSTAAEDNVLPFLAILQKGSPQVNRQEPEYIKGAEMGMILNTATQQIFSGDEGISVIPCGFQKNLVEWIPRTAGGGYIDTHPFDWNLARKMGARKDDSTGAILLPNGHQLVETAYTFVLVDGTPAVVAASSTALGPMRAWMALRNAKRLPNGKSMPSFLGRYRLRTVYQKNDKGDWYNWKIEDEGLVQVEADFQMARAFAEAIAKGEVRMGRPDQSLTGGSGEGTGDDSSIPI